MKLAAMISLWRVLVLLVPVVLTGNTQAHQPVMDMAPRWEQGYGFQLRFETFGSDTLLDGDDKVDNPLRLERYVDTTWLEGVYTFKPSHRVTVKMPYIDQRRTTEINGEGVKQRNSGWGDLVIALPLKRYWNRGAETGNLSFTPSLRLPTGSSSGDFPLTTGSWDLGLSVSYNRETPKHYLLVDLFYWINTEGKHDMEEGNELGLDINLGYHPYHHNPSNSGVFIMWDVSARDNGQPNQATLTTFAGGRRIQTGPILVWYRENVMLRTEYKVPVYERVDGLSVSHGDEFTISLGLTF